MIIVHFNSWKKVPSVDLFFLSNWQTILLNVSDLMLSFLRQRDKLKAGDFFADDVPICPEGWLLVTRVPGSYVFESSIVEAMGL